MNNRSGSIRREIIYLILIIILCFLFGPRSLGQAKTSHSDHWDQARKDLAEAQKAFLQAQFTARACQLDVLEERLDTAYKSLFSQSSGGKLAEKLEAFCPPRTISGSPFPAGYNALWDEFLTDPGCQDYAKKAEPSFVMFVPIARFSEPLIPPNFFTVEDLRLKRSTYVGVMYMHIYEDGLIVFAHNFKDDRVLKLVITPEILPQTPGRLPEFKPWDNPAWRAFFGFDGATNKTQTCPVHIGKPVENPRIKLDARVSARNPRAAF